MLCQPKTAYGTVVLEMVSAAAAKVRAGCGLVSERAELLSRQKLESQLQTVLNWPVTLLRGVLLRRLNDGASVDLVYEAAPGNYGVFNLRPSTKRACPRSSAANLI